MSATLSVAGAEALLVQHLGSTPRAVHSRIVGAIMTDLAGRLGTDADLWRLVGLLHDLDYFAVNGDWSRHGLVTAEWLAGRLPAEALMAIEAHDHRTGIIANGPLASALRLADALAVFDQRVGPERLLAASHFEDWQPLSSERPFLFQMISTLSAGLGLDFATLQALLQPLSRQPNEG